MNLGKIGVVALLILINSGFAIAVVAITHEQRQLFTQLQELKKEQNKLDVEWDRLLLEQSTFVSTVSKKKIAQLGMIFPDADKVIYLKRRSQKGL